MGWCCGLAFGPKGTAPHWSTDDVGKFMSIVRLFLLVLVLTHQGYLGFQVAVAEVCNGKPFRSSVVPHVCQDPISARKLRNIAWYWCSHSPTLRISSWCPVIGPGVSEWKSFKGGRLTSIGHSTAAAPRSWFFIVFYCVVVLALMNLRFQWWDSETSCGRLSIVGPRPCNKGVMMQHLHAITVWFHQYTNLV